MTEMGGLGSLDRAVLCAILDRLLPAWDGLGGAGDMGLDHAVIADAAAWSPGAQALVVALAALPTDFAGRNHDEQTALLRDLEQDDPQNFQLVLNLAYNAYYTDRRVLSAIERQTGYRPDPPQPSGYELRAFDPALLHRVRQRAPLWRPVDGER